MNLGQEKTALFEQYLKMNPPNEEDERTHVTVFSSEFPGRTEPKQAALCFIEDLGHDLPSHDLKPPQLTKILARLMVQCGVEISLFDEFQHLIETQSYKVLEDAAKWLKILINTSKRPVVLSGMHYSRIILDCDDGQLADRFMIRRVIEPFRIIQKKDRANFRTFLQVFDEGLPFDKTPGLHKVDFYPRLFAFSKGNMRRLRNLINFAVEQAVLNKDSELTMEHFSAGYKFYMDRMGIDDKIDSTEALKDQQNPFEVELKDLEFKEMKQFSYWRMQAEKGESRIVPAQYSRKIRFRYFKSLLKRR